jgi:uncharacterized protein YaiL (DUF2058 family)
VINANGDCEYAIIPAVVADKIAQRDADSIVLNSALSRKSRMKTIRTQTSKSLTI